MRAATFHGNPCAKCGGTIRYVSSSRCVYCRNVWKASYYAKHLEKNREIHRQYARDNREVANARYRAWKKANRARTAAKMAAYRAMKIRQTPKWLTEEQKVDLHWFYVCARLMTALTGERWTVDHLVPLRGEQVRGLHVPWNLRLLPHVDNCRKGNRRVGW